MRRYRQQKTKWAQRKTKTRIERQDENMTTRKKYEEKKKDSGKETEREETGY